MRSPIAPASSAWPCAVSAMPGLSSSISTIAPFCTIAGRISSPSASGWPAASGRFELHADRIVRPAHHLAADQRRVDARHVHIVGAQHAAGEQPRGGDRQVDRIVDPAGRRRIWIGSIASPVIDSTALKRPAAAS